MPIIRINHQKNYTCLDNRPIRDERLTLQARGLHNQMLSHPNDWRFNLNYLEQKNPQDSKASISRALRELEQYQYVTKQPTRTSCGRFDGWEYFVYEVPNAQEPSVGSPKVQEPKCGSPTAGFTELGKPQEQYKVLINNEVLNNEILSPPNPLTGEEREKERKVEIEISKTRTPEIIAPPTEQQKSCSDQQTLATATEKKCSAPESEVVTTLATVKYDPTLGIRPPRQRAKFLYPEGPWLNERGCISEDFLLDRAKLWRTGDTVSSKAFGAMALEDVVGLVAGHYQKSQNHAKLETDWQAYVTKCARYVGNVHLRVSNGVNVDASEQQEVFKKVPALLAEPVEPIFEPAAATDRLELKDNIIAFLSKKPTYQLESCATVSEDIWSKVEASTASEMNKQIYLFQESENDLMPYSRTAVGGDVWDEIEVNQKMKDSAGTVGSKAPEGDTDPQKYSRTAKPEDLDFYHQQLKKFQERRQNKTVASEPKTIKNQDEAQQMIKDFVGHKGMPAISESELRRLRETDENKQINYWNSLLKTGLPSVMQEVAMKVKKAGFQIVNNMVMELDF